MSIEHPNRASHYWSKCVSCRLFRRIRLTHHNYPKRQFIAHSRHPRNVCDLMPAGMGNFLDVWLMRCDVEMACWIEPRAEGDEGLPEAAWQR